MSNISCVNLSKLVKRSFYTISDYTYFLASFKVDGLNLSLSEISHLMGRLKFKFSEMAMFLKSMDMFLKSYLELEQGEIECVDLCNSPSIE